MRGVRRAVLIALLIGAGPVLAGCADFDMDKLDIFGLNQKKKLPGERHALFPEGVPGVTQGIPPELTQGHEQAQPGAAVPLEGQQPAAAANGEQKTAATEPPEQTQKAKPKPRPKKAAARPTRVNMSAKEAQPASAEQSAPPQPSQQAAPAAQPASGGGWPPPASNDPSPWPAPPPAGTFSKQ